MANNLPPDSHVSLWDLLTVMCGAVVIGSSWAAADIGGVGVVGRVAAVCIGLIGGAFSVWFIRSLGAFFRYKLGEGDFVQVWRVKLRVGALYLFALGWLVASGVLGYQISRLLIGFLNL